MTNSDALAVLFIALFVGALTWTILYFLALHAFSRSLQSHAPLLWSSREKPGVVSQSNIQRAFGIYIDSESQDALIPLECLPSRNTVRTRLIVAGALILAAFMLAPIL